MIILIGSVTLDTEMTWVNRLSWDPMVSSANRTIGGRLVVQEKALQGGKSITLQGAEDHGWQKKSTVEALRTLSDVPGATYIFTYGTFSTMVRFRHEEDNPVQFEPARTDIVDPDSNEWYFGQILLQEV